MEMSAFQKNSNLEIRYFKSDGIQYCAYKIPKAMNDDVMSRRYANNRGIYIYVGAGTESENTGFSVYVGQANMRRGNDTWADRTTGEDVGLDAWKKIGWEYTIFFTTTNNSWSQDDLDYLQHMIYTLTLFSQYNTIKNVTYPKSSKLQNENRMVLINFIRKVSDVLVKFNNIILPQVKLPYEED